MLVGGLRGSTLGDVYAVNTKSGFRQSCAKVVEPYSQIYVVFQHSFPEWEPTKSQMSTLK